MKDKTKDLLWKIGPIGAGLAAALVFTFGLKYKMVLVVGQSMENTLFEGQTVIADRKALPNNGDILVCSDDELDYHLIKRVIAKEGQQVDIDFENHTVTVDGVVLDEPYIKEPTEKDDGAFEYPVTVPEGCYFVMGDNRNNSMDSRNPKIGFISKEKVLGKVVYYKKKGKS